MYCQTFLFCLDLNFKEILLKTKSLHWRNTRQFGDLRDNFSRHYFFHSLWRPKRSQLGALHNQWHLTNKQVWGQTREKNKSIRAMLTYFFFWFSRATLKLVSPSILGLQPRDKAAMLVVKTKEIYLLNLHQNRVHFPAREMLLFLTTNMAVVTSLANQQSGGMCNITVLPCSHSFGSSRNLSSLTSQKIVCVGGYHNMDFFLINF